MTMRERLEAAIATCLIPGGKECHLELVFAVCEKAKQVPGTSPLPQTTAVVDSTAASQETSEEAAA